MSAFTISLLVNIILGILFLMLVFPKAKQVYLEKKKQGERQRDEELSNKIRGIVVEYLKELQND